MEGVQKDNKEIPSLVEIGSPSTPLDEPNITIFEKSSKAKVHARISRYYWYLC
jgi:hypothetical protein